MKLIPAFEVVVRRNKVTIDLGTLTDEYEKRLAFIQPQQTRKRAKR